MPEYLAPGVFVEETSFRQKTIEGVGTSTAAFVGPTRFGPTEGLPELLTSFGDYERIYGGVDRVGGVDNYMAQGVRAFFENGGRRCYVVRVTTADDATGNGRLPTDAADDDPALALEARYPGRAGNFQVQFTLRMSPNVWQARGGEAPRLRGAFEYQVVWLDKVKVDDRVYTHCFAHLEDAFDEDSGTWTYRLCADGKPWNGKLVSELDPGTTTDARIVTVDVDAGPLGEFMDAMTWQGLGLHYQDRNSIQRVFGPNGTVNRATELSVPLVLTTTAGLDGAALATLLIQQAGAAAGVTGDTWEVSLPDAIGGTFDLHIIEDDQTTHVVDALDFNATAGDIRSAILGVLGSGAEVTVTGGQSGPWSITIPGQTGIEVDTAKLQGSGRVTVMEGREFTVKPADGFTLRVGGGATKPLPRNATADNVDDALEAILGVGNVRVDRSGNRDDYVYDITLLDTHDVELTAEGADVEPGAHVTVVAVQASAGTLSLHASGGNVDTLTGIGLSSVASALITIFGLSADPEPGEDDEYLIRQDDPSSLIGLTIEGHDLGGVPGSGTAQLRSVGATLTAPGASASLRTRLSGGEDGPWPNGDDYGGRDGINKSGLLALEDLPDVSIVAAPGSTHDYADGAVVAMDRLGRVIRHCEYMRYRIAVIDSPPAQLPSQLTQFRGEFDSSHAALYYPWIRAFDPVTKGEREFPPSGFVAGVYARNDVERGVHKAPANEVIALSVGFETHINTAQQELLNPLGVNCLRHLDQRGRRVWGARTMSSDPEWKYVNLRRYFAFLEASIDRGTQWAVFEPNGERLWANVRRTVEDFLLNEFASGHLLGATPEQAFFVRCDRSTMTQNDLDNGRLVCLIGVAPLRPAEFVIFRIGQKTIEATN